LNINLFSLVITVFSSSVYASVPSVESFESQVMAYMEQQVRDQHLVIADEIPVDVLNPMYEKLMRAQNKKSCHFGIHAIANFDAQHAQTDQVTTALQKTVAARILLNRTQVPSEDFKARKKIMARCDFYSDEAYIECVKELFVRNLKKINAEYAGDTYFRSGYGKLFAVSATLYRDGFQGAAKENGADPKTGDLDYDRYERLTKEKLTKLTGNMEPTASWEQADDANIEVYLSIVRHYLTFNKAVQMSKHTTLYTLDLNCDVAPSGARLLRTKMRSQSCHSPSQRGKTDCFNF